MRDPRMAVRWPTGEAFYAQRDDRTMRGVGNLREYVNRVVEIHVDPRAVDHAGVQLIALVAANLTARWARRVRVFVPVDAKLDKMLERDGMTLLAERVEREMTLADPFGEFIVSAVQASECEPENVEPLRLFVGPWVQSARTLTADDYVVHAVNWTALGRRGDIVLDPRVISDQEGGRGDATAAAAGLAGSLGAADLFKRAIRHHRTAWMPTFSWDTWSSAVAHGVAAWASIARRPAPAALDLGNTLLAGVGAIGSAFLYLADAMPMTGALWLLDRDAIDVTNLNRSPMFTVRHALEGAKEGQDGGALKTVAAKDYLARHPVTVETLDGLWREHAAAVSARELDVWISLTNEDGAWAEVPFQLPPVVLHATTTSGWGFGAGRHIPRAEDCTLCRMPRPMQEFRGPCAMGEVATVGGNPIRASLPFLSTASAALLLASLLQLQAGFECEGIEGANDIAADLAAGLPAVVALLRRPTPECRGCRAVRSPLWMTRGGRGRFARYSLRSASWCQPLQAQPAPW